MKILHQDTAGPMTFSYYHWNNKYIIKVELDTYEQTYKIHEMDVTGLEHVRRIAQQNNFMEQVFLRFQAMDADLAQALEGAN